MDNGLKDPGSNSVTFPYAPQRRSYALTRDGITLTVTVADLTPAAGQPVALDVRASWTTGGCCDLHLLFGDGLQDNQGESRDCSKPLPRRSAQLSTTHVWNRAGRQVLQVGANGSACDERRVAVGIVLDVQPGVSRSNGPSLPTVGLDITAYPTPSDPGRLTLYGEAEDKDGYLRRFVLDHGDGTQQTVRPNLGDCQQNQGGTSSRTNAWFLNDPPPSHRYAKPGTYVLTLTAYSTGCDGKTEQKGTATYTFTW